MDMDGRVSSTKPATETKPSQTTRYRQQRTYVYLLAILRFLGDVGAVWQLVEVLARLGCVVQYVRRGHPQHFHDLHHLIKLPSTDHKTCQQCEKHATASLVRSAITFLLSSERGLGKGLVSPVFHLPLQIQLATKRNSSRLHLGQKLQGCGISDLKTAPVLQFQNVLSPLLQLLAQAISCRLCHTTELNIRRFLCFFPFVLRNLGFQIWKASPRQIPRTVVPRCASRRGYSRATTCRWPSRTGFPAAPPVTGRTDSGCTGKSANREHT